MTKYTIRLIALLAIGVLLEPTITECAAWAVSAAGRHACCERRGEMAPETSLTDCCGISQQSSDVPSETQLTRTPLKLLGSHWATVNFSRFSTRTFVPGESSASRRAPIVPLYLQQASLLI